MRTAKIAITESALFQRAERALAKEGQVLRRCRKNSPSHNQLGDYYTLKNDAICRTDVDITTYLKPYEELR